MKLYSPATVRQIIEKYRFRFQKSLGQNFLIDGNIVSKIVDSAELDGNDVVLEIGAGIGTLTSSLAERVGKVIVIEIDHNLQPILAETLADCDNVEIIIGNALKADFDQIIGERTAGQYGSGAKPYKVVANLPYYITTPLIMHALENHFNMSMAIFMIQKEVAERITAEPGGKEYGALTVGVNYYSDPQLVLRVPNKVFMPQPEVESALIRLKTRDKPPAHVEDERLFFKVVKAAFGQRRKTLLNAVSGIAPGIDKNVTAQMMAQIGIDSRRRGETLSLEEFARLANIIYKKISEEKQV
jgi:16S rRNA (adenine1518-N6/adenine1519-N6)-dimethyltransferase